MTQTKSPIISSAMRELTHDECCALVDGSIERGLQTLLYIRGRLARLKNANKINQPVIPERRYEEVREIQGAA